jgi:hypothetical protein
MTKRPVEGGGPEAALAALAEGPAPLEREAGYESEIPANAVILSVTVRDGIAVVDVGGPFFHPGSVVSPSPDSAVPGFPGALRTAQVVYTLTQFPQIAGVRFMRMGLAARVATPGGLTKRPVTRRAFRDLLPDALIADPVPGQVVRAPLVLRGSLAGYVMEAEAELLDSAGRVIGAAHLRGRCTRPECRTPFAVEIPFETGRPGAGTLRVAVPNAEDPAQRVFLTAVPVVLERSPGSSPGL